MRMDRYMVRAILTLAIFAGVAWFLIRREQPGPACPVLTGRTMGSTYTIKLARCPLTRREMGALAGRIAGVLGYLNEQMSTYQPESEISRFNRHISMEPFQVSPDFDRVMRFSLDLARRSQGAFDPTVGPLVNLWGFGPAGRRQNAPGEAEIEQARKNVGYRHVFIAPGHDLRKDVPDLQLDLGAVVQGYAVDEVSWLLIRGGVTNFLVEIGGEATAWGRNPENEKWRVGVQTPEYDARSGESMEGILHMSELSVSTSGDYQKYFRDAEGRVLAHIIDPRTGRPVDHGIAAVTVVARQCVMADGLATAVFVLGPESGLALVKTYPGAAALIFKRGPDGGYETIMSPDFVKVTGYEPAGEDTATSAAPPPENAQ